MPIAFNAPYWQARDIGTLVNARLAANQYLDQQKADAIRWQATQDYETLIRSGVDPRDAYRRLAPRLMYGDPRGLAASMERVTRPPGQIEFDPTTGRSFITQPTGTISPVSRQNFGTMRVRGPDGTVYNVKMDFPQWQQAPTQSTPFTPTITPLPTGQYGITQPSGATTVFGTSKANLVEVPTQGGGTTTMTRQRKDYLDAMAAGATLVQQYNAAKEKADVGERQFGYDKWFPFVTPYTNQMATAKQKLNALGLDEYGRVMPGSNLEKTIHSDPGLAAEVGLSPAPAAPAAAPQAEAAPVAPQAPAAPAYTPRLPPYLQQQRSRVYMGPRRGMGRYQEFRRQPSTGMVSEVLPGTAAAPAPTQAYQYPPAITQQQLGATNAPGVAVPAGSTRVPPTRVIAPGPNQVIRNARGPDGNVYRVIYDTKTKQIVDWVD